jgi:hypothetical protein
MSVGDIPRAHWPELLEEFGRRHKSWLTTVSRFRKGDEPTVEARERPLGAVVPEMSGDQIVAVHIRFEHDPALEEDEIRIEGPATLSFLESASVFTHRLELRESSGTTCRMELRADLVAELAAEQKVDQPSDVAPLFRISPIDPTALRTTAATGRTLAAPRGTLPRARQ